ncbi:MAG: WXG100 family type VII secretion target [Anaerolineae bacterium]|nr:WXG100 family type VII secretion target [Anaerolineae bacterium]
MTTLHFDTDAGRTASSSLANACNNFDSELINLTKQVNNLVGSEWMGNSATQFQNQFQGWSHKMRLLISELESMRQQLDQEIAEWEAAASALD